MVTDLISMSFSNLTCLDLITLHTLDSGWLNSIKDGNEINILWIRSWDSTFAGRETIPKFHWSPKKAFVCFTSRRMHGYSHTHIRHGWQCKAVWDIPFMMSFYTKSSPITPSNAMVRIINRVNSIVIPKVPDNESSRWVSQLASDRVRDRDATHHLKIKGDLK